jgi:hypothetical protein
MEPRDIIDGMLNYRGEPFFVDAPPDEYIDFVNCITPEHASLMEAVVEAVALAASQPWDSDGPFIALDALTTYRHDHGLE